MRRTGQEPPGCASTTAPGATRPDPAAAGRRAPAYIDDLDHGTVLDGRYRLEERVGRGGSATVYRATDTLLRRQVAVKVFHPGTPDGLLGQRRAREMRLAAAASGPHLLAVYDAQLREPDGPGETAACYLVTEFVDGPNLADLLTPQGLPSDHVRRIGAGIAQALGRLHERGLVHRDVKPGNVLLTADHDAKLADLGIAREMDGRPVTQDGAVPGTAPYLSPEQAEGKCVGPPSDVYSLGLVLLECLTGRREFPGGALESAVARLLRDPVISADLPGPWPALLEAMTDRDPDRRPSADEVATALNRTDSDPSPTPNLASPPPPDRRSPVATPGSGAESATTVQRPPGHRPGWILAGAVAAAVVVGALVANNAADPDTARQPPPEPSTTSTPMSISTITLDVTAPTVTVTAAPSVGGTMPAAAVDAQASGRSGDSTGTGTPGPEPAGGNLSGASVAGTVAPRSAPGAPVPSRGTGPGSDGGPRNNNNNNNNNNNAGPGYGPHGNGGPGNGNSG